MCTVKNMNKNEKKKNAIRFGALAVAILLFAGVFSVWALSSQAIAEGEIGDIHVEGLDAQLESEFDADNPLLEDSFAGRPGRVNDGQLFQIEAEGEFTADYTAAVHLINGADLMDEGLRYLTVDMALVEDSGDLPDPIPEEQTGTLTLENGRAVFHLEEDTFTTEDDTRDVVVLGGTYGTYPFADFGAETTVELMLDVEAGLIEM